MSSTLRAIYLFFILVCAIERARAYTVQIKSTGDSVIGSTVNFSAILLDDGSIAKSDNYKFIWRDYSVSPVHTVESLTTQPYSNWTVEYSKSTINPGNYQINVEVDKYFFFPVWIKIASNSLYVNITESLDGELLLIQNGIKRKNEFVSATNAVNHTIRLRQNDIEYLNKNATYIKTYWFRNCTYLGMSNDLSYMANYPVEGMIYEIEALVVGSFEKLPQPITTTIKPTPFTTTTTTTTVLPTTKSSTSIKQPVLSKKSSKRRRRSDIPSRFYDNVAQANAALLGLNLTNILEKQSTDSSTMNITNFNDSKLFTSDGKNFVKNPLQLKAEPPFNCINKSIISRDPKNSYGYFKHRIISKIPVTNFSASGNNWLQHGDLLNLEIKCEGSNEVKYCTMVFDAPYNATGNETCDNYLPLNQCKFNYIRFFTESKTVLFFLRNDISEITNQVTINIYEAKVQSQLSVVVVPVTFSLIAIILVIFGVSYYVQSHNRFTVEVADFNFSDTQSVDVEYKTFQQRLLDSLCEVLPTCRHFSETNSVLDQEPANSERIDSNLRYNVMT